MRILGTRFEPIDDRTLEEYAEAAKRGDVFPAVIAYKPGARARKLVMIDGVHRLHAHERAGNPLALYEVDRNTDPRTIALMIFAINTKHGKVTSENERVAQASYLVDNGASIESAAASLNLPSRILKRALSRQNAVRRADEVGLRRNEWDTISPVSRGRLANITTDEGFEEAARLPFAAKLDGTEVVDFVGLLNSTKSSKKQVEFVRQQRRIHEARIQAGAGGVLTTADRMGIAITRDADAVAERLHGTRRGRRDSVPPATIAASSTPWANSVFRLSTSITSAWVTCTRI